MSTLSACSRNNTPNAPVTGHLIFLNTTAVGVQKWDLRMLIDFGPLKYTWVTANQSHPQCSSFYNP